MLVCLLLFEMWNFFPRQDTTPRCVQVLLLYWNDSTGAHKRQQSLLVLSVCRISSLSITRSSFPHRTAPNSADTSQKFIALSLGALVLHILLVQPQDPSTSPSGPATFFPGSLQPTMSSQTFGRAAAEGFCQCPLCAFPACPDNSPNMACTCFFLKRCLWTEARTGTLTKPAFHEEGKSFPLAEAELLCRKVLVPTNFHCSSLIQSGISGQN